jgi:hypothetical protein
MDPNEDKSVQIRVARQHFSPLLVTLDERRIELGGFAMIVNSRVVDNLLLEQEVVASEFSAFFRLQGFCRVWLNRLL